MAKRKNSNFNLTSFLQESDEIINLLFVNQKNASEEFFQIYEVIFEISKNKK